MKKAFSLVMALLMFLFVACDSKNDGNWYCGTWKIASIEKDGVSFTLEELKVFGDDSLNGISIVIKEGGKACLLENENENIVDWSVTPEGVRIGEMDCKRVEENISVENEGVILTFERASENQEFSDEKQIDVKKEVDDTENDSEISNEVEHQNENKITFTELVAVSNDECEIKITGIDPDAFMGYTLKAVLENKNNEKTYMFSLENASINGVQVSPLFANEVSPGKKSNEKISFADSNLNGNDIGEYTDIELTFRVYDSDNWSADEVARETVHIYPYGEEKATVFVREALETDNILIDNENVSVIVTGYREDTIFGYSVDVYLINKSDKNIMFCVDDASVNGYMVDPYFAKTVDAGKSTFSSITWSDYTLEENDITTIDDIEFVLRAYDADDWSSEDFVKETVTLNP